jgi:hypothetical protein
MVDVARLRRLLDTLFGDRLEVLAVFRRTLAGLAVSDGDARP